jgi:nitrogen-specific signal transduction histidine kinase
VLNGVTELAVEKVSLDQLVHELVDDGDFAETQQETVITARDYGPGVPEDILETLFLSSGWMTPGVKKMMALALAQPLIVEE